MPSLGERSRALLVLAWPIAVSLLSYSIMIVIETLFVGTIGPLLAIAGLNPLQPLEAK